jgi:hypothetical protein
LQAPKSQTLQHVLARADVDCPGAYALTLVGDNVFTQRKVIFRGIDRDVRGANGDFLKLYELCDMAPFDVYSIEIGYPYPALDPPAPTSKKAPECISSDDEAAAGARAKPSPPPAKKPKKAAARRLSLSPPPSPQVQRQWPGSRGQGSLAAGAQASPSPSPVFAAQGRFVGGGRQWQVGLAASLGLSASRSPSPQVSNCVYLHTILRR